MWASGHEFHSTAYYRARYYNSLTGRFLSRDPENGQPTDPKTLHKYLYAGGDPVNRIDPTGHEFLENLLLDDESEVETEVYAKKFECLEDAMDQLLDIEAWGDSVDPGWGLSLKKSLQAVLNCAKKL